MMKTMRAASLALLCGAMPVFAQEVEPAVLEAAKAEGQVSVYSALDAALAQRLVDDFRAAYPEIKVDYVDQSTTELYNRAISEAAAGQGSADLLLSSSMDLQYKLLSDGSMMDFKLAEADALQPWSHTADGGAYGFTQEPLLMVYNKRLVPEGDLPHTRAELIELLKKPEYKDKVATIDPERIGTGFMFLTLDERADPNFWDFADALGAAKVKLYTSTGAMLEKVTSGEHLLAYNIIGSYAVERAKTDPSIGVIYPKDYINAISRIGLIPKIAPHPNAAQVFMAYLVSERAQKIFMASSFGTVRTDLSPATAVPEEFASLVKPATVDATLLDNLEPVKRLQFIKRWQQAMRGGN